jgi:serine/threonine protein kinase
VAAGGESSEGSLGALEHALDEVLQAVDRGTTVDALYLQERYPQVWRELAEMLAFEGKLEGLAPMRRRIGKFKLQRRLGSGGMGTVWLATSDDDPDRRVALKVIHPHLARTGDFFRRFVREAQIGTRVVHPNVVRTLDAMVIEQDGELLNVLVMAYEHGQTLRELLDEMGTVPEQLCRHVGREVARALSELHAKGIVHRDLKPENVLITPDEIVKLMDLGVARAVSDDGRISCSGAFVGSWLYAAPEQFRGDGIGFAADLYALGLVLHEMAAGAHPFEGDADFHVAMRRRLTERPRPVSDANPQVSPFFDEAVATLLHAESRARFESAARVATVLDEGERSDWWRARERELRVARRAPLRRIRVPRDARLHGRGEELAVLDAVFESARSGEGRVAIVVGEAGIGKSRLTDAFVQRLLARRESIHFLYGSYPPGGVAPSDSALLDAFRGFFGREGLESALAPYFDDAPILLETAAEWLRSGRGVDTRTVQSVISRLVHGLAAERPTVLVIEDLHFAPEAGRGLFTALAHGASASPLLVIGTARPDIRGVLGA